MRRSLLAALALTLTVSALAQNPLRQAAAEGIQSMAWKIETEGVSICCCNDREGWSIRDGSQSIEYHEILLVAHLDEKRVTRIRMMQPNCPIRVDRFVPVSNEQSLDFLLQELEHSREEKFVAAISMHDHPRTVTELIRLARHHATTDVRRQAIFWLGQKAGEKAAAELRRFVDEDPEDDVREHAVFAISQLPRDRSVPILIDLVKNHKRPAIRKRAMFWLAQTGDQRAVDLIEEILLR